MPFCHVTRFVVTGIKDVCGNLSRTHVCGNLYHAATFAVVSITQPQRRQLMLLSWYPEALWRSNSPSLVRWFRNSSQLRGCVAGDEPCHVWELQSCGPYQRATCYVSSQHQHWIHLLYQGHTKMKKPTIPSMEHFFRIAKFSTKFRLFF